LLDTKCHRLVNFDINMTSATIVDDFVGLFRLRNLNDTVLWLRTTCI